MEKLLRKIPLNLQKNIWHFKWSCRPLSQVLCFFNLHFALTWYGFFKIHFPIKWSNYMRHVTKKWSMWHEKNMRHDKLQILSKVFNPVDVYSFKVNNGNTRTMCEICSDLTIKTPEWRHWSRSGIVINFERISHIVLVFPLFTLNK